MSSLSHLLMQQAALADVQCCDCGIVFYVASSWVEERRRDHKTFRCPNGHTLHFGAQSEAERLQEELDREKRRHEFTRNARDAKAREAEQIERRRRAEKAAKTRLRNRVAQGKCPCCAQSFPDLAVHMAEKHGEEGF